MWVLWIRIVRMLAQGQWETNVNNSSTKTLNNKATNTPLENQPGIEESYKTRKPGENIDSSYGSIENKDGNITNMQ